jgi:hypothetical protein
MARIHAGFKSCPLASCGMVRLTPSEERVFAVRRRQLAEYHAGLKVKYLRAAWLLWESIPLDPPRPRL